MFINISQIPVFKPLCDGIFTICQDLDSKVFTVQGGGWNHDVLLIDTLEKNIFVHPDILPDMHQWIKSGSNDMIEWVFYFFIRQLPIMKQEEIRAFLQGIHQS